MPCFAFARLQLSCTRPITKSPGGPVDPVLKAIGKRLNATPAQVIFAWVKAKGVVIADYKKPRPEVLDSLPSSVVFVHTDVTSWESMVASFDACVEKFGTVDYVFANAGITGRAYYLG